MFRGLKAAGQKIGKFFFISQLSAATDLYNVQKQ